MRIALLLEYNGKNFCGSQSQKDLRTVQSVLEEALAIYFRLNKANTKKPLRAILSGRTDSGVHSSGQVAHFELPTEQAEGFEGTDLHAFAWSINGILPDDICVKQAATVGTDFHARFIAIERHYVYRFLNRAQRSPLLVDTHYFVRASLDVGAMKEAILCLPGSHDFTAFKSSSSDAGSSICEVKYAKLLNLGEGELEFSIAANHFVYNMIRIIVGTLVEIGLKKRPVDSIKTALIGAKRKLAGPTAPASGLSLVSVKYPEPYANIFKFANAGSQEE
jgi:tRNA pseudouridine38-40 synthase